MRDTSMTQPTSVPVGSEIVRRLPAASRFILQGGAQVMAAVGDALGIPVTAQACVTSSRGGRAVLWLGPNERLLLGPEAEGPELAHTLATALAGLPHSLVDVGHRQLALQVAGPHAAAILNSACPLDLDAGAFPVGMCTRTILAKAEIVLWRTAPETFHLEVWRSFAAYVVGLLDDAGREHGA